jgi:hypothetical protein
MPKQAARFLVIRVHGGVNHHHKSAVRPLIDRPRGVIWCVLGGFLGLEVWPLNDSGSLPGIAGGDAQDGGTARRWYAKRTPPPIMAMAVNDTRVAAESLVSRLRSCRTTN